MTHYCLLSSLGPHSLPPWELKELNPLIGHEHDNTYETIVTVLIVVLTQWSLNVRHVLFLDSYLTSHISPTVSYLIYRVCSCCAHFALSVHPLLTVNIMQSLGALFTVIG